MRVHAESSTAPGGGKVQPAGVEKLMIVGRNTRAGNFVAAAEEGEHRAGKFKNLSCLSDCQLMGPNIVPFVQHEELSSKLRPEAARQTLRCRGADMNRHRTAPLVSARLLRVTANRVLTMRVR